MSNRFPLHNSPAGIAVYPWVNIPDTKFDPDGVYSTKVVFSKEDAKKMNEVIKPLMNGGKNNPMKPEVDDQGQKTGNYVANFKLKAKGRNRKTKEVWDQKPILVDSVGNRVNPKVGGGSKIQVAYEAIPYDTMGGGVSLRMKKVKILDLVEYKSKDDVDWGDSTGTFVGEAVVEEENVTDQEEDFEDNDDF